MATIAVTGASGHLGNVICRKLCDKGFRVKALYQSFSESLQDLPVEMIQGDVLQEEDLESLIEGCSIVINSAAIISIHGDPDGRVFMTNTQGPKNVLAVSRRKGVKRILHISSVHAVEETPLSSPFDETRPYKDASAYAYDYSKAQGEQILLDDTSSNNPEIVILRPSSIIGPYDFKPSELGKALLQLSRQKIPALPEGGYDFVDVRDVADAVIQAIELGKNREVYLLSGKYYSISAIANTVYQLHGKKNALPVLPYWFLKSLLPLLGLYNRITGSNPPFTPESIDALKFGHPNMDATKAQTQLGHQCRSMETSIQDFFLWYNQHTKS